MKSRLGILSFQFNHFVYFKFIYLSSSHEQSSKRSSKNGKIDDERADEAADGPSTSGAEAPTTSNTKTLHEKSTSKSKVNYLKTFLKVLFLSIDYFRKRKLPLKRLKRRVSAGRNNVGICWIF